MLASLRIPSPKRPFTHDTMIAAVQALGGEIVLVVVHDFVQEGHVFLASIVLEGPGGRALVDSRPSDAISVALRAGVPILVSERVLSLVC